MAHLITHTMIFGSLLVMYGLLVTYLFAWAEGRFGWTAAMWTSLAVLPAIFGVVLALVCMGLEGSR